MIKPVALAAALAALLATPAWAAAVKPIVLAPDGHLEQLQPGDTLDAPGFGGGTPGGVSGQLQLNSAGAFAGVSLAGDCTFASPTITCGKTGGVAFAPSATVDTTDAGNITAGSLAAARLAAGAAVANLGFTPLAPTGDASATTALAAGATTARALAAAWADRLNIKSFGAKGDWKQGYTDGAISAGSTAFFSPGASFAAADAGKAIVLSGAGAAGTGLVTTIAAVIDGQHLTLAAAPATAMPQSQVSQWNTVTDQAGAGSYAPGDTLTLVGGTGTAATATVFATEVHSATVAAAGSGGTDGTCTVSGTSGVTSPFALFTAPVTISGGGISAVNAIADNGVYTANPTLLGESVAGCGLIGATLNLTMGVLLAVPTGFGDYSTAPTNPAATTTSGAGTGATFNPNVFTLSWGYGTDDSAALVGAIDRANALRAAGTTAKIYFPAGWYFMRPPSLLFSANESVGGDGHGTSIIYMPPNNPGSLFSWSGATLHNGWGTGWPTMLEQTQTAKFSITGLTVIGDRFSTGDQVAFEVDDSDNGLYANDFDVRFVKGSAVRVGKENLTTSAHLSESYLSNFHIDATGDGALFPAMDIDAQGSGENTNEIRMVNGNIFEPYGVGLMIHGSLGNQTQTVFMTQMRVEGGANSSHAMNYDLMSIGDAAAAGQVNEITCTSCFLVSPAFGKAALRVTADSAADAPNGVRFSGIVGNGLREGMGAVIDFGSIVDLDLLKINTKDYDLSVGNATNVPGPVTINVAAQTAATLWRVDPTNIGPRGGVYDGRGRRLLAVSAAGLPTFGDYLGPTGDLVSTDAYGKAADSGIAAATVGPPYLNAAQLTLGSGSWAVPSGVSQVNVCLEGGGGGGGGVGTAPSTASGGLIGFMKCAFYAVAPGGSVTYGAGAAGAGGAAGANGGGGAAATFGALTAAGGNGGVGSVSGNAQAPGGGAIAQPSAWTTGVQVYSSLSASMLPTNKGSAGVGGAGQSSPTQAGGAGGANAAGANAPSGPGQCGAGGGGAATTGTASLAGGAGGAGCIEVRW